MASRNTQEAAEELKNQFQSYYPKRAFAIIPTVYSDYTRYDVLEVRQCQDCGGEYHTAGIGEADNGRCFDCDQARRAEINREHEQATVKSADEVARHMDFDRYSE